MAVCPVCRSLAVSGGLGRRQPCPTCSAQSAYIQQGLYRPSVPRRPAPRSLARRGAAASTRWRFGRERRPREEAAGGTHRGPTGTSALVETKTSACQSPCPTELLVIYMEIVLLRFLNRAFDLKPVKGYGSVLRWRRFATLSPLDYGFSPFERCFLGGKLFDESALLVDDFSGRISQSGKATFCSWPWLVVGREYFKSSSNFSPLRWHILK